MTNNTFQAPAEYINECKRAAAARNRKVYAFMRDGWPLSTINPSMIPWGSSYTVCFPNGNTMVVAGVTNQ